MFKRRKRYEKAIEVLTTDNSAMLEVPTRTPLDWRDNPIGPGYGQKFVEADAQWLDHIFQLLHQHSPTFRAMINNNSYCANFVATLTPFETHDGAVNKRYGEVDIHQRYFGNDLSGLWMIAHEYRHLWQEDNDANIYGTIMKLSDYDALNFAVEADANAFASTCLHEVLTATGYSLNKATVHFEKTALSHIWQKFLNAAENLRPTAAFEAFLEEPNAPILKKYQQTLRTAFSQAAGRMNVDEEYFHIAANGGLYVLGPEIFDKNDAYVYAEAVQSHFARLKSMPYEDQNGQLVERRHYLQKISLSALRLTL